MPTTTIAPHDTLDADQIQPLHAPFGESKLEALTESMRENGWAGRPLLVEYNGDAYQAWTGSHRLAAARATGTTVPVVIFTLPPYGSSEEVDAMFIDIGDHRRDDDRLEILEALAGYDDEFGDAAALMKAEVLLED